MAAALVAAALVALAMAADTPLFDERGRASERRTEQRALHCRSRLPLPVDGPQWELTQKSEIDFRQSDGYLSGGVKL